MIQSTVETNTYWPTHATKLKYKLNTEMENV